MVEVAFLAATAAVVLDSVAITATRFAIRSAAMSASLSFFPSAQRNSIVTLRPSTKPASLRALRNPARRLAFGSGEPPCRNPITGMAGGCCARASAGHAAVPPRAKRNSRRFMSNIRFAPLRKWRSFSRTPSLPPSGRQVLGPDLNCPELPYAQSGSFLVLLPAGEDAPQRRDQPIELDRLGVELVASGGERLLARAGERMRGERDDRNVARVRIALEAARGLPAVDARHFKVHQHDVRPLGGGHLAPLLAVLGGEHLELLEQLEPHLEHVDVVVVVFDLENLDHDAASMALRTAGLPCTRRRMRSTSSAGRKVSLTRTDCTPEFRRARSSASRSRAVTTITGISRQPGSFCRAATTEKPSISGIMRSSRIMSGVSALRRASASCPFAASCTVHCWPSSQPRTRSRCRGSSSTTRTLVDRECARKRPTSRCKPSRSIGLLR